MALTLEQSSSWDRLPACQFPAAMTGWKPIPRQSECHWDASRRFDGKTAWEEPAATSALPLSSGELFSHAERDLSEAESIAERGSMLIWQIVAALERTRLALELQEFQAAKKNLDRARGLVHQTDKPCEPYQSTWEDWNPPESIGVFQPGESVGYHCRDAEIKRLQLRVDSSTNRR